MERSSRVGVLRAFAVATVLLLSCSGGGDGTPPPPDYVQADAAGTWDAVTFQVGAQPGWTRRTLAIDGAGMVEMTAYQDDVGGGLIVLGPVVLKVGGAGDLTQTVGGVSDTFRGVLARSRKMLTGVSTPEAGTYDLTVARKRDAAIAYDLSDIADRPIAIHTLRDGPNGWSYAVGTIDSAGVVSIDAALATTTVFSPPLLGATLSVDPDGAVSTAGTGGQFEGFLSTDKNTIFAVHTDGGVRALTVIQLKGGSFAQADLAGTWAFSSLASNVQPGWVSGKLAVDAAGRATYLNQLDSAGSTALSSSTTFHLDPDGLMTSSTNPSYRGTLALDGDTYVRTQTHSVPGRYGIGVVLRR